MIFAVQTQPIQIILCFSFGYLSGVVLAPFFALGYLSKIRVIKDICSFLELIFLTIAFVFLKNAYALGEFRAYMGIICLLGFYIYKKTLGKSIAILLKKLYNKASKAFISWRKKLNDRRKSKKNTGGNNFNRRNTTLHFGFHNGLSNGRDKGKKGKNRAVTNGNSRFGRTKRTNAR